MDEFTMEIECAHGSVFRAPVDVLRGSQPLIDPCPRAVAERKREAERRAARVSRWQAWLEVRRLRRSLRDA